MAATSSNPIPSLTGNAGLDSLIGTGIISLSAAMTTVVVKWLAEHNISDPSYPALIGSAIVSFLTLVAAGAWRFLKGRQAAAAVDRALVAGTAAGMHITAAGAAIGQDGNVIQTNDGSQRPVMPTVETARAIVKNFGPDEHAITEALNAAQLRGSQK